VKSRKLGMFAKRSTGRCTSAKVRQNRNVLRRGLMEKLEDRKLMTNDLVPWTDGKYYPLEGLFSSDIANGVTEEQYLQRALATNSAVAGRSLGGVGEDAYSGRATTVSEAEPNNNVVTATFLPLGSAGSNKVPIVNVIGNLGPFVALPPLGSNPDEDYYSMDLRAGDIVDVKLTGSVAAVFDVTLLNASGQEIAGRLDSAAPLGLSFLSAYPPASPLAIDGNNSFAYTIPAEGRYYVRVSDGFGGYSMTLKTYRPALEKQPIGTVQKVFVDFDGARVNTNTFGLPLGTVRLSALNTYFAQAGIQPQDEALFIRTFMNYLKENFHGSLPSSANNGWRTADGVNGHFDIEFLNSWDHPDPVNDPLVTRLIIGGDGNQFPLPVRGISNSVDIGNFETAGITLVLPDVYMNPTSGDFIGSVPRAANVTLLDATAKAMAATASHELGHSFGAWHQDNSNSVITLMDSGGLPIGPSRLGVGVDGIYGTADDIDIDFGKDSYAPIEGNIGVEDTAALMAYALSTGIAGGGTITGNVYVDRNVNRSKDSGEPGLDNVRIYADLNNNNVFDNGEYFAYSNSSGIYTMGVPTGTFTLRAVVPTGYRLTTPVSGSVSVTVAANATVSNINFGQEQLSLTATGVKWNDVNGNGLRDNGEGVITGVRMYLDLDGDGRIDIGEPSSKTNDLGQYTLTFPGSGTYKIREVVDPGYVQTFPSASSNFEHTVVLTGNPSVDMFRTAGLNFGNKLTVDFGDAPSTYGDASAGFKPGLLLGANWDDEQGSQYSSNALGDDAAGVLNANDVVIDDEDGVVFTRPLVAGNASNRIAVTAVNTTGVSAYFNAWIDFNRDGDVTDSGEQVFSNTIVGSGTTSLSFAAPANASLGTTIARFRYSSERDVAATGRSLSGEVEDYVVNIVATLDLAVNDRFTVSRNSVLNSLNVVLNDFALPGEQLEIVSTSGSTAGGVVQISANNQILYTPPAGFIGQDIFTYTVQNAAGETDTASVTVDVKLFFVDPVAVDDSYDLAVNAIDLPLNVLSNDIEGQAGALTIIMVTQPNGGGQVSIASGGKSLRYTPVRGFNGSESFTYTVADSNGKQATAKVTLHTLPYVNATTDVVYSLRTTDLNGNEISAIQQGQDFKLEVYVDDFRNDRGAPSNAPGVFAAYVDLLYNYQLVSTAIPTNNNLNFDVDFFNGYTNGVSGDSTIPGLIDEFGAFYNTAFDTNNPGSMNYPDIVRIAAITFTASSPGIVTFFPDPADVTPLDDTLLFDVPGSAVPESRIRFLSTALEIVGNSDEFPLAIDDSLTSAIPFGATRFPINVKANDLPGSTGVINVVSVTQGQNGSTSIDSQGRVLYTPNGGFTGADQFSYTIEDSRNIRSQATVTVRVGAADNNDLVDLRLEVTDLNGAPITTIAVGGTFQLRGYVKDIRATRPNQGVFAAYQDILYSSSLVNPKAKSVTTADPLGFEVVFGTNYQQVISGDITNSGIINEIGAVQNGSTPLGAAEQLLFIVTLDAKAVGTATFIGDPADIKPLHDTLTFDPAAPVSYDLIRFGSDTLNITSSGNLGGGEFTNKRDRFDVNADGFVSPIDALIVINHLNAGSGNAATGEGEPDKYYIDVNGDNALSPIDALLVINRLNSLFGSGEGEGEDEDSSNAVDSFFGEESGMDQLLSQLAPDLEDIRKKR
jgi:large repetitive protein